LYKIILLHFSNWGILTNHGLADLTLDPLVGQNYEEAINNLSLPQSVTTQMKNCSLEEELNSAAKVKKASAEENARQKGQNIVHFCLKKKRCFKW